VAKTITVFSAPHPLQGSGFVGYVDDPHYADLIDDLLSTGVDFVFEVAGGRKPSIAKTLVESFLGLGHCMDVDPPLYERPEYGIVSRAKKRPNLFGCHCLSFAFRLVSAGVNVTGVHSYMPYSKLCNLQHK
jgi:hypothetical protein